MLSVEQKKLVHQNSSGAWVSSVDILISTPGRLVEHMAVTAGFTLADTRFLVIDEADKLLTKSAHDWLAPLSAAIDATIPQVSHALLLSLFTFSCPLELWMMSFIIFARL